MTLNYITLGARIRSVRKKRKLSQIALAELVDCSPTYLSYIENGERGMNLETFVKLANTLTVTADELLVDSLINSTKFSNHELAETIADCSEYEKHTLIDVLAATKEALRKNAFRSHIRHK